MKRILFSLMLGLLACTAHSQSFARLYEDSLNLFQTIRVSGNLYATRGTNWVYHQRILFHNGEGTLVKIWDTPTSPQYTRRSLCLTPLRQGGLAMLMYHSGGQYVVYGFDAQGDSVWALPLPIDSAGNTPDNTTLIQLPDNGFVLAETAQNLASRISRYDAQGNRLWLYKWNLTQFSGFRTVVQTADVGFIASGYRQYGNSVNPLVVKVDSNGVEQWAKVFPEQYNTANGMGLYPQPDGTVYMIGNQVNVHQTYIYHLNAQGDSLSKKLLPQFHRTIDLVQTADGGFGLLGYNDSSHVIMRLDSQYNLLWIKPLLPTFDEMVLESIAEAPDGGFFVSGSKGWGNNPVHGIFIKTDPQGNVVHSVLHGRVVFDGNTNCTVDGGETGIPNNIVDVLLNNHHWYGYPDANGHYAIQVYDSGQANITWHSPNPYFLPAACQGNGVPVTVPYNDSISHDIFAEATIHCPALEVTLSTPFLRRCFGSYYDVAYCNNGTLASPGSYLEITVDPLLVVDSASVPWDSQNGNLYRWNIGNLNTGQCGSFRVWVTTGCFNTVIGQTHCTSAHLYPDTLCLPVDTAWDGSSIQLTGTCLMGDSLYFTIRNAGASDMTAPVDFVLIENASQHRAGQVQLAAGATEVIALAGNGNTYILMADQVPGHPGYSHPMVFLEGCGVDSAGSFEVGYATQYPQDDQNWAVDVLCQGNIGAYDPNDKRSEPQGLGPEGNVLATQELRYTVRFQNTGTDTAFLVIVRDTLSPHLDITTLQLGPASHPFSFEIVNSNILQWTFFDIQLPDSNVNQLASNGYLTYSIQQKNGNAVGTQIENRAGIYFDFNDVVVTNTTLNTVFENYKGLPPIVGVSVLEADAFSIFPNPNTGIFSVMLDPATVQRIAIYNGQGTLVMVVEAEDLAGSTTIDLGNQANGLYLAQLQTVSGTATRRIVVIR